MLSRLYRVVNHGNAIRPHAVRSLSVLWPSPPKLVVSPATSCLFFESSPSIHRNNNNQQQQLRWQHSQRQIKRVQNHPKQLRADARLGIDRTPEPCPPPQYPQVFEPFFLPNGWSAPPGPDVTIPEYPFHVKRTKNKPNDAMGFLPVYATFRKDGSKVTTRVKKVAGDQDAFLQELRSILNMPAPKNPNFDTIRIRVGGTIEVKGNRTREIKYWLASLGF